MSQPRQHQDKQPGIESEMRPSPKSEHLEVKAERKLEGKVALITGGDSGIGRAVALLYASEGADVVIVYLDESSDARDTLKMIKEKKRKCLLIKGDIGEELFCEQAVVQTITQFGKLDILVNNAAEQHPQKSISDISNDQLKKTFRTNIFSMFYLVKAALPYLKEGSCIINTASVTAYKGSPHLLDYSSTKGAIVSFTRSLAQQLADKKIRVNGVAPGPVWTPLIPSTFDEEKVSKFGDDVLMKRAGQPAEIAPCYLFLASNDSSYMSGQMLHPNGGTVVNG